MDYAYIGRLGTTHGLNGQMYLTHKLKGKNILKKLSFLFIEIRNESYIPYKIDSCQITSNEDAIVVLDDVYTLEDAKQLIGKKVYIESSLYEKLQPADLHMNFTGFKLYDATSDKLIGTIADILEYPSQLLAQIFIDDKEVLLPIVESQIKHIHLQKKEISIEIPEGLIDIYLNG